MPKVYNDGFIEDDFVEDALPPLPKPPTAADVLGKMAMPPVPKANNTIPDIISAAGENLLPPGISFENGLPVLSMDSLKRGMSPMAGQYGVSKLLETSGSNIEKASVPIAEKLMTDNPLSRNFPKTNAAVMTIPALAEDMTSNLLKPSGAQQYLGTEGMGFGVDVPLPLIGKSVKELGKGAIGKIGNVAFGIDKSATQQAIKNPEILNNEFSSPDKIETITRGLKQAVEDMRGKISKLYDSVKNKLDKPGNTGEIGKVKFEDVVKPIEDAKKALKVGEPGLTRIDVAQVDRIKQLEKEVLEQTDLKTMDDFFKKRPKNSKFAADDMLEIRKRIDHEINYESTTPSTRDRVYKKQLSDIRNRIDNLIREAYPEIKAADAFTAPVKKAEQTLRRKTGIVAGKELNEVNEEKVNRLAQSLFNNDRKVLKKSLEEVGEKIGANDSIEKLKDIAASKLFDTGKHSVFSRIKDLDFTGGAKGLFKTAIRGSKSISNKLGKSLPFLGAGVSKIGKREK